MLGTPVNLRWWLDSGWHDTDADAGVLDMGTIVMAYRKHPFPSVGDPGAAGHGVGLWWAQRVSAVALAPLGLWLVVALAGGAAENYTTLTAWLSEPLNAALMIMTLITGFHHAALGLQVVAEDYIHSAARFAIVVLIQLACFSGAVAGSVAVLITATNGTGAM